MILRTAKFCLMVFRMHLSLDLINSHQIFRITASISCKSSLADIISFILSWIDKENRSYILDSFRKSSKSVLVFGWLYNRLCRIMHVLEKYEDRSLQFIQYIIYLWKWYTFFHWARKTKWIYLQLCLTIMPLIHNNAWN